MRADLKKGHGVAIIPSSLRTHRYVLRIVGVTYRDRPLREPLSLFYDKRRPLPPYATAFCKMLAGYEREAFPISVRRNPSPSSAPRSGKTTAQRLRAAHDNAGSVSVRPRSTSKLYRRIGSHTAMS